MKFRPFVRVLAALVLIGQLAPASAALACSLRHRVPATSCEGHRRTTSGPAVSVTGDGQGGMCVALPCLGTSASGLVRTAPTSFLSPTHAFATGGPALVPASVATAPIPPPPEA